ncbi:zinc-dependent metalloprotease [Solwaraspora sp. WMMD791]|uniref:zinc-dependent metalloprotease n=1 Tax=Solwaraspora sp. WMMD791 TaxID=3016086 RepID=UPI00249C6451|nr:zinc-dependent metalloprotease [Solwaraspora sp. WMMD791]WFE26842.1 zinc-dependent metalloprotease [Solwaraspora sp. WMMD791]
MPDIPFGFQLPGGQPPDPNDPQQLQQFMAQLQQLLAAPGSGPVNWDLARQVAASQLSAQGDPAVNPHEWHTVSEALRVADLWLESSAALPSGIRTSVAWNRNEWIYRTLDVWRKLCDPVAGRMVGAMGDLVPPEARGQLGPMQAMMTTLGGALFGGQLGQALGSLATEVLSASDIGLPLGPAGTAALLPANIKTYGAGLELPEDEVRLYVALREAAHQRLFEHVPWLRGHVLAAVETYASGITVNREAIEDALGRVDPTNPESMQEIAMEGIFTPEDTAAQKASLARIETVLALIEGWVGHVVDSASADRLPNVVKLAEAFRRRRAAGGPAEQTFAALVGLELRPRRLREAAALWAALTTHRGVDGRDAVWSHPDLLPSDADFADPDAFARATFDFDLGDIDFSSSPPEPPARPDAQAGPDAPQAGPDDKPEAGPDAGAGPDKPQ